MTNAFGSTLSPSAALLVLLPNQIAYEPFGYTPGANLAGQVNANGQSWSSVGPSSATRPGIAATNLSVPGLAPATGQAIQFGGNGTSARFNLGAKATNGTIYFSMTINIADLSGLTSNGVFWAAFNNSTGSQSTTPTNVAIRVVTRAAGDGFNLGLDKSFGTVQTIFAPQVFTTTDIIFLVGSYTFNPASGDDVAQLWINPPPATLGQDSPPPATLTNSSGADVLQIVSFVLFDRSSAEPATMLADELRVGWTWASVTPPGPFNPSLAIAQQSGSVILSWDTNYAGFALEQAVGLAPTNLWGIVPPPSYIFGGRYFVTNSINSGPVFFRLRKQ